MYKRAAKGWLKHLDFMVLDLICLHVAFVMAYMVRHGLRNPYAVPVYGRGAITLTLIQISVSIFFETFKNVLKRGYYKEFAMTLKQVCLVCLLMTFYLYAIQEGAGFSRTTLYLLGLFYALLGYPARILWKMHLKRAMSGVGKRSLLIVTVDNMVNTVVNNIRDHNYEMFHITGIAVINCDLVGQEFDGVKVVANQNTVVEYVCREWIDEVFINIPQSEPYPEELLNKFIEMGVAVHMKLVKSSNLIGQKQFVERLGNYTVLTTTINCATTGQILEKRAMDILGGLVGCLITGVLFICIGPLIYIQSPGPIFFSQVRVGQNGKKFKIYKFRSMYLDAEERKKELMAQNRVKDGMMFKLDWDPRIIGSRQLADGTIKKGIGNIIRDWSLDEFPQFFNVLMGDMSLVGTRPPTVDEWERYELHHRVRLATKPGITGLWQVSGRSNITDFEEVVQLDRKYIAEWTLGLDIKILLKTVAVVLGREGSM